MSQSLEISKLIEQNKRLIKLYEGTSILHLGIVPNKYYSKEELCQILNIEIRKLETILERNQVKRLQLGPRTKRFKGQHILTLLSKYEI